MFQSNGYDVLIVGARCAGAAAAMLMARRGLKVLAIDRGRYGDDALSTHALMRGGVQQLSRWGLLPRIVASGAPAIRAISFHYGDEIVDIPIKPGGGVDALYAPRRAVLDRILVDAAREAGAEIRFETALVDLICDADGRVRGVVAQGAGDRPVELRADLVVGADGVGSRVARLVGAPVQRAGVHAAATVFGYWEGLSATGYRWLYRDGVSAGVIPTNDGLHCVFAAMPPARYRDAARRGALADEYWRVVAETSPELADEARRARLDGALRMFAGVKGYFRQPIGPGWALVGDAGYFKDPLTAHGMTDALRDAELLAAAAAQSSVAAFDAYALTRDALSLKLFETTDVIASFAWDLDALRALHKTLNAAMKEEVAHMATLEPSPARAAA